MMVDHSHLDPGDNGDSRRQSPSPNGGSFPFSSGLPPNEPAQPGPPVPDSTVSLTAVDAAPLHFHPPINPPTQNLADTSSSSPPASPTTSTNASSVSDSSTRLSAIQTVQTYLTHEAQAIQSHLTAVLPGLIQVEVRAQCAQLAQEIGSQISSIRAEVIKPTRDQDDLMLPSDEEGENEDSRGRSKRSAKCSRDKRKEKGRHHSRSPGNGNVTDEDEDDVSESDEETIAGKRKYNKKVQALRVSINSCSITNTD